MYVHNGTFRLLQDLIEADTTTGIIRTGADWSGASNYTDALFTRHAVQTINKHAETYGESTPFYGHMAFHGPHDDPGGDTVAKWLIDTAAAARGGSDALIRLSQMEKANDYRRYSFGRALMATDGAFGSVVNAMNETGMLDQGAVIVVTSDNGGWPCATGLRGSNWPLRGSKFHYTEGALRVPAFVYATHSASLIPSSSRGGTYSGLMHHVDWLTTFAALASIDVTDDPDLDGKNQWSAIAGAGSVRSPRNEIAFALDPEFAALRLGRYKLVVKMQNSTWWGDHNYTSEEAYSCVTDDTVTMLFDIEDDPNEHFNLYPLDEYASIAGNLSDRARALYAEQNFVPTHPYGDEYPTHRKLSEAYFAAGNFIVPWGCHAQ